MKEVQMNFRLSQSLKDEIEAIADVYDVSNSDVINVAINTLCIVLNEHFDEFKEVHVFKDCVLHSLKII